MLLTGTTRTPKVNLTCSIMCIAEQLESYYNTFPTLIINIFDHEFIPIYIHFIPFTHDEP